MTQAIRLDRMEVEALAARLTDDEQDPTIVFLKKRLEQWLEEIGPVSPWRKREKISPQACTK